MVQKTPNILNKDSTYTKKKKNTAMPNMYLGKSTGKFHSPKIQLHIGKANDLLFI